MNLLRHGRRTCHARRPACSACALARMCPSAGRSLTEPLSIARSLGGAWERLPAHEICYAPTKILRLE